MITPNRLVALLTPIFASVSGLIAAWIAEILPGTSLDETELTAIFIAAAIAATTAAQSWLKGWREFEAREAALEAPDVLDIPFDDDVVYEEPSGGEPFDVEKIDDKPE